jgi:CheY-like chemotaxis protein
MSERKILVVDDNQDSADSLKMLLELLGFEVRAEYDGPAALSTLEGFTPDYVLLDIGLPGMNGHEVARRLRSMPGLENTKIIAVTGWGQDQDKEASKDAGFHYHLVKPIDVDDLTKVLGAIPT